MWFRNVAPPSLERTCWLNHISEHYQQENVLAGLMQSDMSAVKNLKLTASARGPPKNWKCKHQQGLSIQLSVLTEFRGKKVNTVSGFIAPPWGAHCVWHELSPGPGNINLLWHDHSASQETSQSLSQRVQLVSQAGSKPDRLARSAARRAGSRMPAGQLLSQSVR